MRETTFASVDDKDLLKWGLLLKVFSPLKSEFFPIKGAPNQSERKAGQELSPLKVSFSPSYFPQNLLQNITALHLLCN